MRLGLGISDARRPLRAPSLVAAPVVTGPAEIAAGAVLAADLGVWARGRSFSRAWLRDGTPIPGASGSTYAVTAADVLGRIAHRVTASNPSGDVSASSAAVAVPAIADFRTGAPAGSSIVRASDGSAFDADSLDLEADRVDFGPNVGRITPRGWLCEDQLVLSNEHVDPGAYNARFPIGTTTGLFGGATRVIEAVSVPGYPTGSGTKFTVSGTPTSTGNVLDYVGFERVTSAVPAFAVAPGQDVTMLWYVKLDEIENINLQTEMFTFRGASDSGFYGNAVGPAWVVGPGRYRAVTANNTNASVAQTRGFLRASIITAGLPVKLALTIAGIHAYLGSRQSPIRSGRNRAKDAAQIVWPDGADGDVFSVATEGQTTHTLTRAQLFAATGSRVILPIGAGDLPNVGNIPAGGLEAGYRQTAAAIPG